MSEQLYCISQHDVPAVKGVLYCDSRQAGCLGWKGNNEDVTASPWSVLNISKFSQAQAQSQAYVRVGREKCV